MVRFVTIILILASIFQACSEKECNETSIDFWTANVEKNIFRIIPLFEYDSRKNKVKSSKPPIYLIYVKDNEPIWTGTIYEPSIDSLIISYAHIKVTNKEDKQKHPQYPISHDINYKENTHLVNQEITCLSSSLKRDTLTSHIKRKITSNLEEMLFSKKLFEPFIKAKDYFIIKYIEMEWEWEKYYLRKKVNLQNLELLTQTVQKQIKNIKNDT